MDYLNPSSSRKFTQWFIGYVDVNTILSKLENMTFDIPVECILDVAKQ